MAKMFYTMEETKAALGKSEEEVRQIAREGRLREFRDGPRLMFKADQVEQVKADLGTGGGTISLSGDSTGGTISLAGDSGTGSGLAGAAKKQETHFGDVGVSPGKVAPPTPGSSTLGSLAGSGLTALSGTGLTALSGSGLSSGSRGTGITIFDADDAQKVDPSAQTAINAAVQQPEKVSLESVGSGSGLLDLTRESDDTSLGAVFDDLSAGKRATGGALDETQAAPTLPASDLGARAVAAPMYVEAADPVGAGIGAAALIAAAVVCFGAFILGATLLGYRPDILKDLEWNDGNGKLYLMLSAGIALIVGVIGFVVSKASNK